MREAGKLAAAAVAPLSKTATRITKSRDPFPASSGAPSDWKSAGDFPVFVYSFYR